MESCFKYRAKPIKALDIKLSITKNKQKEYKKGNRN